MLTDAKVRTLKSLEKSYRILDAERLYIEVRPTVKKFGDSNLSYMEKKGLLVLANTLQYHFRMLVSLKTRLKLNLLKA